MTNFFLKVLRPAVSRSIIRSPGWKQCFKYSVLSRFDNGLSKFKILHPNKHIVHLISIHGFINMFYAIARRFRLNFENPFFVGIFPPESPFPLTQQHDAIPGHLHCICKNIFEYLEKIIDKFCWDLYMSLLYQFLLILKLK